MKLVLCLALLLLCAGSPRSHAQGGGTQIIAITGTAAPGFIGRNFTSFGTAAPVLNGSGTVAFVGSAGSDLATGASVYAVYKTTAGGPVIIARTSPSTESSQSAPLIGGTFTNLVAPLLNESGTVAFYGINGTTGVSTGLPVAGIYTGSGGALSTIAAYGQLSAGLGTVTDLGSKFSLGDSGRVVFTGNVSDGPLDTSIPIGVFAGTGGNDPANITATTVVSTTQTAPGIGGLFTTLDSLVQNNLGFAAFTGYSSNGAGLYAKFGGTLGTITTTLQTAPVIGGNFTVFSPEVINDKGTVAFVGTSSNGGRGIYTGTGGALTTIATTAQSAPGLAGNFTIFGDTLLSNSGLVAFRGVAPNGLLDSFGNPVNGHGIYTSFGGTLQTVATTLQAAPMLGGNFAGFGKLAVNDLGTVAFAAVSGSTIKGLYLGDGQELVTAAYLGQSVSTVSGTTTISALTFTGGVDRGGSSQFNNNGQVVYRATLANGTSSVLLFTPALHFRNAAGGSWATRNNWTVGILPASVHDVLLDPTAALSITGPMLPTTVKSLQVGSSAGGVAELVLQSAGAITATDPTVGVSTFANGKIRGNGKLIGKLTNAGTIAPGLPSASGTISVMGNVILAPTSHLALDLGGLVRKSGFDWLSVSGTLTLGGNLDITLLGGFAPQLGHSFDLFDAASTTGTFSLLNLPSLTAGLGWNTSLLATTGVISVSSVGPVVAAWNATGGGSWSASLAGNWSVGVPNGNGAVATLGTSATGPATITVDGAKTVGSIVFNNTSSYTVAGPDSITLADSAATPGISVTLGSHTISAPLVLAQNASVSTAAGTTLTVSGSITGGASTLTKTGAGTLNLDGTQSYATLNATAGTTNVDGTIGTGTSAVSVTVAGTMLKFGSVSQKLSSLTIGAGARVTFTSGAASFGGGGKAQELGGSGAVPEPGSLGLLLTGVLGLLARRRRTAARV